MKPLNVSIVLSLLALIAVIATQTPLMHEATTGAQTAATAPTTTAPTKDAAPSYYLPSEFAESERNAPESGEPAPTF